MSASSVPRRDLGGFLRSGHLGTLLTSLVYFDFCFAVWVLNAAMAPFISEELHLTAAQKGVMLSVPVFAGALLRLPMGILAQYIGRKRTALLQMSIVIGGLLFGWRFVDSLNGLLVVGVLLGVAGSSFGIALSLGAGWYPPQYKGLASGIAAAGNSGAVLAMLLAPPLAQSMGWRAVYGFATLPIAAAMILMMIFAKEPPDAERKPLRDYLSILVDRDAWVFNVLYMVTFGGYIGLTSFLPTLFHDGYGIDKQSVGTYAAGAIIAASALRVVGGWLGDKVGGARLLPGLFAIVVVAVGLAATIPASPVAMAALMIVAFAALGAGNGAVFQLVPLRFAATTAVAGSLIGEIGALAGGLLPNAMGAGKQWTGTYSVGFLGLAALAIVASVLILRVMPVWNRTWARAGVKAAPAPDAEPAALAKAA